MQTETITAAGQRWQVEVPETLEELGEKCINPEVDVFELARQAYLDKVRQSIRHWCNHYSATTVQNRLKDYTYGSLRARHLRRWSGPMKNPIEPAYPDPYGFNKDEEDEAIMKVFTFVGFPGRWPVGTAAVVVATDMEAAKAALREELKKAGLIMPSGQLDWEVIKAEEVDRTQASATILLDGDY